MPNSKSREGTNTKPNTNTNQSKAAVTVLGDSTIDNKLWISPGIYRNFLYDHLGIKRDSTAKRLRKADRLFFKPELSIVENLVKNLPTHSIFDYSNDGFTTSDCLDGQFKDKVFGVGTFKLFPHEKLNPLKEAEENIKKSSDIILSVGGNNFREFILDVRTIKNKLLRQEYIQNNFYRIVKKMQNEYIIIVNKLRKLNKDAKIILMTQYYPSTVQNNYKIYPFMQELGRALNVMTGSCIFAQDSKSLGIDPNNPMDVAHELMKIVYLPMLKQIPQENIVLLDITSSLDPYDKNNIVNQIEPSGEGGKKIGQALKYVIQEDKDQINGMALKFEPHFFKREQQNHRQQSEYVKKIKLNDWTPNHPFTFIDRCTNQEKLTVKKMLTEIKGLCDQFAYEEPLNKTCIAVFKDAEQLLHKIYKKKDIDELITMLNLVKESLKKPNEEKSVTALEFYALRLAHGGPSTWKKFSGSLLLFIGAVVALYGVTDQSRSFKMGSLISSGSLLFAGGASLFYSGRRKSISKSMSKLAALLYDKQIAKFIGTFPRRPR